MDLIKTALNEYGNEGIAGIKSNENVLKYFHEMGFTYIDDDDTAWCAAFLNWILWKNNIKGTGKLNARSFLEIGTETFTPEIGDIVVLWRISRLGVYGHCGIFVKRVGNIIYILGGNQDNSVKIKGFSADQLLGYRRVLDK
jgi:uncharacterized protein (TIGR02594 family)